MFTTGTVSQHIWPYDSCLSLGKFQEHGSKRYLDWLEHGRLMVTSMGTSVLVWLDDDMAWGVGDIQELVLGLFI